MSTVAATANVPKIATLAFYPQQRPGFRIYALWHFSTFMLLWHIVGQTWLGFEQAWAHPMLTIATACVTQFFLEWVDAKANRRMPRYSGSVANFLNFFPPAFIVGGALGMLLYPNELLGPAIFAAVISIASKPLVRVTLPNGQKHHIFNPSNFGICVVLLMFPDVVGIAPPYHFTENLTGAWHWALPSIILCSGLFLHFNATGRLPLCLTWLAAFAIQAIVRSWINDNAWYVAMMPMSSAAFIVFTLYMIPDPATTPLKWWRQILFAAAVATVYALLLSTHIVFGLFLSLGIVCAVRGISIELYTWYLKWKGEFPVMPPMQKSMMDMKPAMAMAAASSTNGTNGNGIYNGSSAAVSSETAPSPHQQEMAR